MSFEVTELLKFWTERIIKIDATVKGKPRLGLRLVKVTEVICMPHSEKKVELRLGREDKILHKSGYNLKVAETILASTPSIELE